MALGVGMGIQFVSPQSAFIIAIEDIRQVYHLETGSGSETEERTLPMKKGDKNRYAVSIPTEKSGQILRFRIHAADGQSVERFYPSQNDLRPALCSRPSDCEICGKVSNIASYTIYPNCVNCGRRRNCWHS